ncbi:hypothetical protein ISU10_16415 [Nocardioides agariphilus]|uniref:Uncharacterized protein n=1 Tax=Nocardioides agariphilus TaxID=433664 RepID=A0A930VMA3_9ACTN|nr:hypothetical protein [Nocardioides agariphilus]MBF4769353.1 hypothetical protein [Nocardioides agariphilus]
MTNVVIAGITPASMHLLRFALSQPTIEVVGIVTRQPGDELTYGFVNDSAASQFRGTAAIEDEKLVLAGRHGRGGLRHDLIPVYAELAEALAAARSVDCVVLAGAWEETGDLDVPKVVRLGSIADPVVDAVARVADALGRIGPVAHTFTATIGEANEGATQREQLVAARGVRAGDAVRPGQLAGGLSLDVIGAVPGRALVTSVFLVLGAQTDEESVLRRLRAAGRGALADCVRQDPGPMGSADVVGSPVAVLDLSTLRVDDARIAFALFVDPLAARTRLACAAVTG